MIRRLLLTALVIVVLSFAWFQRPAASGQETDAQRIDVLELQVADLTHRVKLLEAQTHIYQPTVTGPIMGTPSTPTP